MNDCRGDISNSRQLEEIKKLIIGVKSELQDDLKQLGFTINDLKQTIAELQDRNSELESRLERLERRNRKNNIVVFGLSKSTINNQRDLAEWIASKFRSLLEVNVNLHEINNVYYIGKQENTKRPLIVEFTSFITKTLIFKNINKLKGKGISITHDLSPQDRKINKVLVANLREARSKKLVAYIRGNNLHIGEEVYSYQDLVNRKPLTSETVVNGNAVDEDDEVFVAAPARRSISTPCLPRDSQGSDTAAGTVSESLVGPTVPSPVAPPVAPLDSVEANQRSVRPGSSSCKIGNNTTNATKINKPSGTPTTAPTRSRSTRLQGQPKK